MYDVIVIGCGVAGSSAGFRLSSLGYKTLMIDPCEKKKVCAGILTSQYVKRYGINEDFVEKELRGIRISFKDIHAEINYKNAVEYSIDRHKFDIFNRNKAISSGAELLKDYVLDVRESDSFVNIITKKHKIKSSYVIVASGVSELSCMLGGKKEYAYCVQQRKNIKIDEYFEMNLHKDGYSWVSPKKDHVLFGTTSKFGYPNISGEKALIPIGGVVKKTFSKRILLTGDAAGFVSPFEGEGIYYAKRSGEIAADVISDIISINKEIENYEKIWKREFDFKILEILSVVLSNTKILEHFVKEIRDNSEFNKLVENILTKEKKLNLKEILSFIRN